LGKQWIDVYNTLDIDTGKAGTLKDAIIKFDKYFRPQINVVYERYQLCTRKQGQNVPINEYKMRLKSKFPYFHTRPQMNESK